MAVKHRILQAALAMGQSTVKEISADLSIPEGTVRTTLNSYKPYFKTTKTDRGQRGGQVQLWEVRPEMIDLVNEEIAANATSKRSGPKVRIPSSTPELVTSDDLNLYEPQPSSTLIPKLMRRLLASSGVVTQLSLPDGEGIRVPGYDGRVKASLPSLHVPNGDSVWEIGAGGDPRDKANADYKNRTDAPGDIDSAVTTFVMVVSRRFREKESWKILKRSERKWKDVWILDADDLAAWVESDPSIHIWLSLEMGLHPNDVVTLESWFENWLRQTDPPLPATFLLAGREAELKLLCERASATKQLISVYSRSREESLSFGAAALRHLNPGGVDNPYTPLLVKNEIEWARLTQSMSSGILVPDFENADVSGAAERGLTVVVPLGPGDAKLNDTIELRRIDRVAAATLFEGTDVPRTTIETVVECVDRSITAFRRTFSANPQRQPPAWATGGSEFFPALILIGAWDEGSVSDCDFVSEITDHTYKEVQTKLKSFEHTDDPPFIKTAGGWTLTSPKDAALLIRPMLTRDTLERWTHEVMKILEVRATPSDSIGVGYSASLRSGLTRSAILLGDSDEHEQQEAASSLVRGLLIGNSDVAAWNELDRVLPNLAEAAPAVYLDATEAFVRTVTPELVALISSTEENIYRGPWSSFVGLIWSLELLSQSPDHCERACLLLCQLADLDPDGTSGNHPFSSLRRSLVPWFPQIALDRQGRTNLLEGIVHRFPDVGWRLVVSLLPGMHDSTHPLHQPTFRNWLTHGDVSIHESYEGWKDVARIATDMALDDPGRLVQLIESTRYIDVDARTNILTAVSDLQISKYSVDAQVEAWSSLRETTAKHRQFPDAKWSLDDADLARLEKVVESWTPSDVVVKHAYLFSGHPQLPSPRIGTDNYEEPVSSLQNQAFVEIMAEGSEDNLQRLIQSAPDAYKVGIAIANNPSYVDESKINGWFDLDAATVMVARAWLIRSFEIRGERWRVETLKTLKLLTTKEQVVAFGALAYRDDIFDLLDVTTKDVQKGFWSLVSAMQLHRGPSAFVPVTKFLEHGRPAEAVHYLSTHRNTPATSELILRALTDLKGSSGTSDAFSTMLSFEVGNLLDLLAKDGVEESMISEFEFAFFPLLQYERPSTSLFHQLSEHPSLFVELVTNCYRGKHEERNEEQSQEAMTRTRLSYDVLREWRTPPGTRSDGTVDFNYLAKWVTDARERLAEVDRTDIGDECIGQLLSGATNGSDGIWPLEEVRDIVEVLNSAHLRDGLEYGQLNSRGVTTRGIFDGGAQEVGLASRFEQDARQIATKWPSVARVLRNLADHYRRFADHEELQMQRMRDMRA